jgi:thiol-disulfide isomerase/thioredoxin
MVRGIAPGAEVMTRIGGRQALPPRRRLALAPLCAGIAASLIVPVADALEPWRGGALPAARLVDEADRTIGLDRYRGHVLVLNLWATWCGPCRAEMPSLQRLRDALAGRRVEVVAVNIGDSVNQIEQFLERVPLNLPILRDPDRALFRLWGIRALPTTFVFDPRGRVRYREVGERDWGAPQVVAAIGALASS